MTWTLGQESWWKNDFTEERDTNRAQDFWGSETIPSDRTRVDTCYYTFVKTHQMYNTQKTNHNINYGLWVLMMYQCLFTDYNKYTILVGDVDYSGGCEGWWEGCRGTIFSTPLCCEPKTTLLKNNSANLSDTNIGSWRTRASHFQSVLLSLKTLETFLIN